MTKISTGAEICDALGLDPKCTTAVNIRVRPGKVVTVTVAQHLPIDGRLTAVLRKFSLAEIPSD